MVNGRVKLILVIAIICWVLLTIFILFLFWLSRSEVKDKYGMVNESGKIIAFEYSSFGGMDGSSTVKRIEKVNSQKAKITYRYETVSGKVKEKTKKVPVKALQEIDDIFVECDVANWGELKRSDLELLDAPTTRIVFITENESYAIYDYHETPKQGEGIFSNTITILEKYFDN